MNNISSVIKHAMLNTKWSLVKKIDILKNCKNKDGVGKHLIHTQGLGCGKRLNRLS